MFGSLRLGYFAIFALVVFFVLVALCVGDRAPLKYFDFFASKTMVVTWILPPAVWLGWLAVQVAIRRTDRPTLAIFRMIRRHRHWLLRGTILVSLTLPAATAFSTIKQSISDFVPFYADPALAHMDRLLFFGVDPWRITHAVLGPVSTLIIDRLYILWFTVMMGLIAWYIFTRDQKLQVRGILSYLLTWFLLGNVAAMAMASVGPCFYEIYYGDTHFRPLLDTLREYDEIYMIKAFGTMNWLYENRDLDRFAGGISAMPSLHVGIAFLMFLTVRHETRSRWLIWPAGLYALIIEVGSVHLGWHYAIDGLFSVVGVSLIWWATGRFVDWLEKTNMAEPGLDSTGGHEDGYLPA